MKKIFNIVPIISGLTYSVLFFHVAHSTPLNSNPILSSEQHSIKYSDIIFPTAHFPANFIFLPHKPIYNIPYHYIDDLKNSSDLEKTSYYEILKKRPRKFTHHEMMMQLSIKLLLARLNNINTYFTYTFRGQWQLYFIQHPYFRAYDHEASFFGESPILIHEKLFNARLGFVHQSNGEGHNDPAGENISKVDPERSWDRIFLSIKADIDSFSLLFKCWSIIKWKDIGIHGYNYNPTIMDFLGYGKLTIFYRFNADHQISLSKRLFESRKVRSWSKTWELMYVVPVLPAIQIIVRGFSGFGANITSYNYPTIGLGCGIALRFK